MLNKIASKFQLKLSRLRHAGADAKTAAKESAASHGTSRSSQVRWVGQVGWVSGQIGQVGERRRALNRF